MAKDLMLAPSAGATGKQTPAASEVWRMRAFAVGLGLAIMWGTEVIDLFLGGALDRFGIAPRSVGGLVGIPLAPFLHGGFGHLIANTIPFAVLGLLTVMRGIGTFVVTSVVIVLAGGLGVWLIGGSNSVHIGASGLIFGYLGYNIAMGIFERSLKSIVLAALVGLLYGSMIFGVLPGRPGISWEGHLFGAAAGVGWAYLVGRRAAAVKAKAKAKA